MEETKVEVGETTTIEESVKAEEVLKEEKETVAKTKDTKKKDVLTEQLFKFLRVAFVTLSIVFVILFVVIFITSKIEGLFAKGEEKKEEFFAPEVTNIMISQKLETISELTTAKLACTGVVYYEEGKIPVLTQKSFCMKYSAEVRAGIDVADIIISVSDDKVDLVIPKAKVGDDDIIISADSIVFFNEDKALFNWEDKSDALDAITDAAKDIKENADLGSLEKQATEQAESLIVNLLEDAIGDRTLCIRYQ